VKHLPDSAALIRDGYEQARKPGPLDGWRARQVKLENEAYPEKWIVDGQLVGQNIISEKTLRQALETRYP
jgi:hypothetical protein